MKADLTNVIWNPQYKTLEHWRGIAALWVMLFHGFGTTYEKSLHPFVELFKSVAATGWLGVHLFFVISGYCIAANIYRLVLSNGSPWTFIKDRAWRLLPTYWAAFLVTIVLNLVSSPFNHTSLWECFPLSWQAWLGNLFLVQPYLDTPFYNVVYWSLVVELVFYLIATLLLVIWTQINQNIAIFIGLTLGVISVFIVPNSQLAPLTHWGEFVCGILVFSALLAKFQGKVYRHNLSLILIVILGSLSIWINFHHPNQSWFSALFGIILYLLYYGDSRIASIKNLHWLKVIGAMSYSLYLLHVPLQGRVINLGLRFIPTESIIFLLLQILGWSVAIIGSYRFYQLVEKPLNDWRHRQKKSINLLHENSVNG